MCLLVLPHDEGSGSAYRNRLEFNVADGLRLWLAHERFSFDRRTSGMVTVHATAVVVNSYSVEGLQLPLYASDMLNATDVFTNIIHDNHQYHIIVLRMELLPWRLRLLRAPTFCPVSEVVFSDTAC